MNKALFASASVLLASGGTAQTVQVLAAHVIDPARNNVRADRALTLVDGNIVRNEAAKDVNQVGTRIDWSHHWVTHGPIDLHTHIADGFGQGNHPAALIQRPEAEECCDRWARK